MKALTMLCCMMAIACGITTCNGGTTAPAGAPDTHDADVKAISATEDQWNKDYVAKDLDKIAAHYADDAVLMAPGTGAMTGKQAIHDGLQEMLKDPAIALQFHASNVEVAKSGDWGYTQGSYTMTASDPKTHKQVNDHGSYVTTYRKEADGSWKAVADIATSAVPSMPIPEKKK
ncbi:MAG TPA: SgcJ/EcaC family oxidoreductase [Terracidiphilus sp.]|nr:SgcJ/EcaC family oxidoreductase [Terracidiphilus sp.]